MTIGTLVHITAAKKLMIKISEETYDSIYNRLYNESKKKNFSTERLAVYSRENDDGEDDHFAMVTPDKYDKQNMPKFEKLLRKDINFSTRMKTYDFMNEDNEQVCGINLELISIHQRVKSKALQELSPLEERKKVQKDEFVLRPVKAWLRERSEEDQKKEDALQQRDMAETEEYYARTYGKERAIDEDVEKHMASVLAQLPPKLERQTATGTSVATRRRRTPVAPKQELTDVEEQVKYLDDLIAANERAISAGSDMSDPDE